MESTGYEWHQVASSDVNKRLVDTGGHKMGTGWRRKIAGDSGRPPWEVLDC